MASPLLVNLLDALEQECYPFTNGEAVSVEMSQGGSTKVTMTLDEALEYLRSQLSTVSSSLTKEISDRGTDTTGIKATLNTTAIAQNSSIPSIDEDDLYSHEGSYNHNYLQTRPVNMSQAGLINAVKFLATYCHTHAKVNHSYTCSNYCACNCYDDCCNER